MFRESSKQFVQLPKSIMNTKKDELTDIQMQIEGNLPKDLQGHVFIVAPIGTINSKEPFKDGNTFLNGDGMIYRFDFNKTGEVNVKTRLVRAPDYWVDKTIEESESLKDHYLLRFHNHGIVRFSYLLGSRNELNTAFLPMKFEGESNERLLITYDAGRPYEIDLETLEVVTPVGAMTEWQAEVLNPRYPFNPILSAAHPAFDTYKHQLFTVNYGRSLDNILGIKLDIYTKSSINSFVEFMKTSLMNSMMILLSPLIFQKESKRLREVIQLLLLLTTQLQLSKDFVYIMCWDGQGSLKRWKLVNHDKTPVRIKQSMHQIGLTEDYVVLMDTSFTTGIDQLINNPWPADPDLAARIREFFQIKPSPDTIVYIVRRDDLKEGQDLVVVKKVIIRGEACHFLVDYKNPNNTITLHVAHICAWNVAEWVRSYDKSPYDGKYLPKQLHGMQQCETDISWMGRYVIDVSSQEPKIKSERVITDDTCTWGSGLFAYLDRLPSSNMIPEKLDNIYWVSLGLWKDLMTEFMSQMYKEYPYRTKPLEEVLELAKKSLKPSCLYRLHTSSNEAMAILDNFAFPKNHVALSPQFVPRSGGEESSINGYIVCTVSTPQRNEVWIFDAGNLKQGPLCKLHHPELNFGFSLHTTWLKNINSREASYKVQVKQDYQESVNNLLTFIDRLLFLSTSEKEEFKTIINNLFEQSVYAYFE